MNYLLGIDIGSYSAKGVLLDETGTTVATLQRPHKMLVPQQGHAEHDPEETWWNGFAELSQGLLSASGIAPGDIAAIGCSGIGPCMLPVDASGTPLRSAILYGIDTRAYAEIAELDALFGADEVFERCGNALTTQSVGPKIRWFEKHQPDLFRATRKIVGCSSYIVHKLTSNWVVDHYSASTATPCYDLRNMSWNREWTEEICPADWMPEPAWSSDIAGKVTAEAAARTGLAEGTPVIAGTIDAAAEALSVGVRSPGDLMIMYGTTVFFIQINAAPSIDKRYWAAPGLYPGSWAVMGGLATGGALTHWFRDNLLEQDGDDEFFARMAREAGKSPPGANGLIMLPYFSGERTPVNDPHASGMIFGLTLHHRQRDLYRALLEGIAHAVRHNLDTFAEAGRAQRIYAVGGGTQNDLWLQSVSDVSGVTQIVRQNTTGAALGSAFLAGIGAGLFAMNDIERINPVRRNVEPDLALSGKYDSDHRIYLDLYRRNSDLMRKMSQTGGPA